jgi:hypothetical protein
VIWFWIFACWEHQSSGKSSVLESIVGRDFLPRGSGLILSVFSSFISLYKMFVLKVFFVFFSFNFN